MKLKYKFVVKEVAGKPVALAVGKDSVRFNGMINLNETGKIIFELINERDVTEQEIVNTLVDMYKIDSETAESGVKHFVSGLHENGLIEE